MKECPKCSKELDDNSNFCNNCGYNFSISTEDSTKENESTDSEKKVTSPKSKKRIIIIVLSIIVAIAFGVGVYFFATKNSRTYETANELYASENFEKALEKFKSIEGYKDSDELAKSCEYELTIDGQFMRSLKKSLQKRWDLNKEYESQTSYDEKKAMNAYCDAELEILCEFENKDFENSELQEDANTYIGYLKSAKESLKYYSIDYSKYDTQWSKIYAQRTILIKKFTDKYGLKVDDSYQSTLDGLIADSQAAEERLALENSVKNMLGDITYKKEYVEYGSSSYILTLKNTTDTKFEYFFLEANILDKDGNIVVSGSTGSIDNWNPNAKATTHLYLDKEIDLDKYQIEYTAEYSVAD